MYVVNFQRLMNNLSTRGLISDKTEQRLCKIGENKFEFETFLGATDHNKVLLKLTSLCVVIQIGLVVSLPA